MLAYVVMLSCACAYFHVTKFLPWLGLPSFDGTAIRYVLPAVNDSCYIGSCTS